jgi:hypothetical protein
MDLLGAANETNHQAQRLSLSLGSRMLVPQFQYRQRSFNSDLMSHSYLVPREEAREAYNLGGEQVNNDYSLTGSGFPQSSTSLSRPSTSYGTESFAVAIGNSRYLKPAQSLLEEIVHVSCQAVEISNEKYVGKLFPCGQRGSLRLSSELKVELWGIGLVQAEKHELQLKIAKLIALLKEVSPKLHTVLSLYVLCQQANFDRVRTRKPMRYFVDFRLREDMRNTTIKWKKWYHHLRK